MRNSFFSLLLVLLVVVGVVGFMRGWFVFSSHQQPSGNVNMELSVDPNKARADAEKVRERTDEFIDRVRSDAVDLRDGTVEPRRDLVPATNP